MQFIKKNRHLVKIKNLIGGLILGGLSVLPGMLSAQPSIEVQDAKSAEPVVSDSFEGSIYFVQETLSDTSYYTYHVKGNMVRMDIHSQCENCIEDENSLIFDLKSGTITAVHPKRKLYMNIAVKPYIESENDDYKINRTRNNKKIHGYKCYQWRVKNKVENTEIAYWVAEDNFFFFDDFLKLWNRSEKHAIYYLKIPETEGFMPMLSVERTTLRDQKMRLEVLKINEAKLNNEMFRIPDDYKPYDN